MEWAFGCRGSPQITPGSILTTKALRISSSLLSLHLGKLRPREVWLPSVWEAEQESQAHSR